MSPTPDSIRIKLDEKDFFALVAGKIVRKVTIGGVVEMILADIGFDRMHVGLHDAMKDRPGE